MFSVLSVHDLSSALHKGTPPWRMLRSSAVRGSAVGKSWLSVGFSLSLDQ